MLGLPIPLDWKNAKYRTEVESSLRFKDGVSLYIQSCYITSTCGICISQAALRRLLDVWVYDVCGMSRSQTVKIEFLAL